MFPGLYGTQKFRVDYNKSCGNISPQGKVVTAISCNEVDLYTHVTASLKSEKQECLVRCSEVC